MSLLGLDGVCDWSWGWVSVGCVMFLGMGVGVPYVTVWLVLGLWVSWWVWIVGLDSGSVCGYEILTWLWVVVFWSVGIWWWVMIWFE